MRICRFILLIDLNDPAGDLIKHTVRYQLDTAINKRFHENIIEYTVLY